MQKIMNSMSDEWKLILTQNIMLSMILSKSERINMLVGYAETLGDTLSSKLKLKHNEHSVFTGLNDLEQAYIDLDDYVKKHMFPEELFSHALKNLEIVYIEKNVDTLAPLSLCSNLKLIILDGYWIQKYNFNDLTPLKDIDNYIYIWHNSGDTHIDHPLDEYTNIRQIGNIHYSEYSSDPWADYCFFVDLYSKMK